MKNSKPSFLAWAPIVFSLLLLTRCSGSNSLTGSVSEIFPVQFNSVTIWRDINSFQVTYYYAEYGQESIVVQLSVELDGLSFGPGKTIDLSGNDPSGNPRTSVIHLSNGEAVVNLPTVQSGSLTLNGGGQIPGEDTNGSFELSFVNNGQVGAGHTISGNFDGPLQSAQLTPDANFPFDAGPDGGLDCGIIDCGPPDSGMTMTAGSTTTTAAGATTVGAATSGGGTTAGATTVAAATTVGATTAAATTVGTGTTGGGTTAAATTVGAGTTAGGTTAAATTVGASTTTIGASTTAGGTTAGGTTAGATSGGSITTTGGTTGGSCSAMSCVSPGECSVNGLCCASGAGTVATGGTCMTDCDCVSLNCGGTTCN